MTQRRAAARVLPAVYASAGVLQTLSGAAGAPAGDVSPSPPAPRPPLDPRTAWILARRLRGELRALREVFDQVAVDASALAEYACRELRPPPFKHNEPPWNELTEAELAARWKVARKFHLVRAFQRDGRLPPGKGPAPAPKSAPTAGTAASSELGGGS